MSTPIEDDLITIIDLMHEAGAWAQDRATISELHDLAHYRTGGDKTQQWENIRAFLDKPDSAVGDHVMSPSRSPAWPDVRRRGRDLLNMQEAIHKVLS